MKAICAGEERHHLDVSALLASFGPLALFIWMMLDSLGLPLPTEVLLLSAGYLAGTGRLSLPLALGAALLGALAGCALSYRIGRAAGLQWVARIGRPFGIKASHLDRTQDWFVRHGKTAVLLGRLVPVVRNLAGYPAGMVQMPLARYLLFSLLGYGLYTGGSIVGGYALGENWKLLLVYTEEALIVAGGIIVLIGALYWFFRFRPVRRAAGKP